MRALSQRLVRFALIAAASLLSYARPASAQLPLFVPDSTAPSQPEVPAPAAPPQAPTATEPASAALPEAPDAPPGAVPADALSGPAAAKADVITERRTTTTAREDEAEVDDGAGVDEPAGRRRWYGWQTLVTDGASLTALIVGASIESHETGGPGGGTTSLLWLGFLGYEAAPAVVHAAHRNPGRAFASMGIRLGMPLAGAFLGASIASGCDRNLCEASGAGVGVMLGMAGAMAIDAAVFSYDDVERAPAHRAGLRPLIAWTPHTAWVGLGGQL
jgi:hypothetical protein